MRHLKRLSLVLALACTAGAASGLEIFIPMDEPMDLGSGPAIYVPAGLNGSLSFRSDETPGYCRNNFGSGWFYGPYVDFRLAGLGDLDFTGDGCALTLEVDLRYFQTGNYSDAPVRMRAYTYSADGTTLLGYRDYEYFYMVQRGDDHYPTWSHAKIALNNPDPIENRYGTTAHYVDTNYQGNTFDPTKITRIRFYGTDWAGTGGDFLDMKNLHIFAELRVGPDLTLETAYPGIQYKKNHFITSLCAPPAIVWSVTGPTGMAIDDKGILTWTPAPSDVGNTYPVVVQATNGTDTRTESFDIQVVVVPPTIKTIPTGKAYAGSVYLYQPSLAEGTLPVTWAKTEGPAGLTVNATTGAIGGWTPTAGEIGSSVTIGIQATNAGGSDTEVWQVQVVEALTGGDEVAPPWGTVAANISGTQSSGDAGMVLHDDWGNAALVDWTLDVKGAGLGPATHYGRISFDEAGNLYWKTIDGFLASATPTGTIRWTGNVAGTNQDLGAGDMSSPVVGQGENGNIYVTTDAGVAAFSKADGHRVWDAALPNAGFTNAGRLTPVLYQGFLYVVGAQSGDKGIYVLKASTGEIVADQLVSGFEASAGGQMTLVPSAFGPGAHGLYFNADGGGAAGMYAVVANPTGAYLAWKDYGGKVARSHVVYVSSAQRVCTHTWGDYGATFYAWNLDGSLPASSGNAANNSGHGFEDLGAVDFNGVDVIAGGFSGQLVRYLGISIPGSVTPPLPQVVYDSAGFEGFLLGTVVGQDGWARDNAGTPQPDPEIVKDPTSSGHGKVLSFAPTGTSPDDYTSYMGAVRAAAADTGAGVTIEWDQYFTDTKGFMWLADNVSYNGWYTVMHNGSGLLGTSGDSGKIAVTPGVWQHVAYIFNPAAGTVTLQLGDQSATAGTSDVSIAGIDFEVGPGASGSGPLYVDNVVIRQGPAPTPSAFAGNGYYQMDELYRENRGYGGLFKNQSGHSIVLTGTSTESGSAHVVAMDVTATPLLTEAPPQNPQDRWFDYDTMSTSPPVGGPILGPTGADGKQRIYFFQGDTTGTLVALTFKPRFRPDCNNDGKVNKDDLDLYFVPCYTGPMLGPPVPPEGEDCSCADLNTDGHVDQVDFGLFQRCLSNDMVTPFDPNCYP
ncbi:MAG TPA: putative Ig domain-containing protein [Phycisphaerae bacterium]|nr:putative Ig domain-containing protein [Phycisphaerae bacterium]HRY70503.1 putative Ig domain-containing protein [Phycisphaerae bacterium]HSA28232.1 putative Ig domain-containing protein [Phycisphaerae bacterium]